MKALSLMQPWATLMVLGHKTMETRSRNTTHRGLTVIHASKTMPLARGESMQVGRYTVTRDPGLPGEDDRLLLHYGTANRHVVHRLFQGCLLGYGNLVATEPVETARVHALDSGQYELGDYSPGRHAWYFTGMRRLQPPINHAGALGFFPIHEQVAQHVEQLVLVDRRDTARREAEAAAADA